MGLDHMINDKSKNYARGKATNQFHTEKKLGTAKNPACFTVKTEEKREELRVLCAENGWTERTKVKPDLDEDLKDLEILQRETAPVVNEHNTGRNDPCHCGSGKKYKKCCLNK